MCQMVLVGVVKTRGIKATARASINLRTKGNVPYRFNQVLSERAQISASGWRTERSQLQQVGWRLCGSWSRVASDPPERARMGPIPLTTQLSCSQTIFSLDTRTRSQGIIEYKREILVETSVCTDAPLQDKDEQSAWRLKLILESKGPRGCKARALHVRCLACAADEGLSEQGLREIQHWG